jgi:hypothetical protein
MTLHYRQLFRCFSSYGRASQHLPGGADMYSQHRLNAKLLNRVSLHRLFRVGATVYLTDIYESHFTLCITQNASLHRLFRMGERD